MKNKRNDSFPSGWQLMWLFAAFDLPSVTPEEKRAYREFREHLLKDGFNMMQFSVYYRFCGTFESAEVHLRRATAALPEYGVVQFFMLTDRQFGRIQTFIGKVKEKPEKPPAQLQFF